MIPARINGVFSVNPQVSEARGFYEGLGWQTERSDHVFVPFPLAATSFALWSADSAGPSVEAVAAATGTFSGGLLSLVVDDEKEVDALLAEAAAAGGRVVVEAGERAFGRAGWWVDPLGTTWEISWILGHGGDDPFDGAAGESAVATTLAAVTIYTTDPVASQKFYAEGLGWDSMTTTWAGKPAIATDGALLAFGSSDDIHPVSVVGGIMLGSADEVDAAHAALVASGAVSLTGPSSLGDIRSSTLRDPNGVIWDLAHDPAWACTPDGPLALQHS